MIKKLRSNYRLSSLIVRILFVLGFIFCNWQDMLLSTRLVMSDFGMSNSTIIPVMLLAGVFSALLVQLIASFLTNIILNFLRLYNLPRAEYVLILLAFVTIYYFALGLLNLVNLFTPILLVWGGILFPLLVSIGCAIAFYKVTADLYFNVVTRVYYFKSLSIIFLVVTLLGVAVELGVHLA